MWPAMGDTDKERSEKTPQSLKTAIDDVLQVYSNFLRKYPVLTKALTRFVYNAGV